MASRRNPAPRSTTLPYDRPAQVGADEEVEEASGFPSTGRNGPRVKDFCFTIFGTDEELEKYWAWFEKHPGNPTWFIVGREVCPDTRKKHLQGAMVLGKRVSFKVLKQWFPFKRAHIEPMRGEPVDSQKYCQKEGDFLEFGTCPAPKAKPLDQAIEDIRAGKPLSEIARVNFQGSRALVIHGRGLQQLESVLTPVRTTPPVCLWLYGPTGVGKTRTAFEVGERYCQLATSPWISADQELRWFYGYYGQPVAIFDDFRPKKIRFDFILRLTDRYPFTVPLKGSSVNWAPKLIFFTTPCDIATTFAAREQYRAEDLRQLRRRIHGEFDMEEPDSIARIEELLRGKLEPVRVPSLVCNEDLEPQSQLVDGLGLGVPGGPAGPHPGLFRSNHGGADSPGSRGIGIGAVRSSDSEELAAPSFLLDSQPSFGDTCSQDLITDEDPDAPRVYGGFSGYEGNWDNLEFQYDEFGRII